MSDRRFSLALWLAGIATFSALYAPQGVLTALSGALGVTESSAALVVSVATLGLAAGVLPWAFLSARIGRVKSLRAAAFAASITSLIVPFMPSFELLLVARFVQGFGVAGIAALTIALVFEFATGSRALALAGTYVAATTLGGLAGRLVSGPIGALFDWRFGIATVSVTCAILFAAMLVALRPMRNVSPRSERLLPIVRALLRDKTSVLLWCMGGILIGVVVALYNFIQFRLEQSPFDVPEALLAFIFIAYLAGTASARISGRITSKWGSGSALICGSLLMFVGLLITIPDSLVLILAGLVVMTGGMFLCHAVAAALVAARAGDSAAHASASYTIVYYLGSALFGWAVGFAWQASAWTGVVLALGALILVLIALSVTVARSVRS